MKGWTATSINRAVADSIVGRRFRLEGSGHVSVQYRDAASYEAGKSVIS